MRHAGEGLRDDGTSISTTPEKSARHGILAISTTLLTFENSCQKGKHRVRPALSVEWLQCSNPQHHLKAQMIPSPHVETHLRSDFLLRHSRAELESESRSRRTTSQDGCRGTYLLCSRIRTRGCQLQRMHSGSGGYSQPCCVRREEPRGREGEGGRCIERCRETRYWRLGPSMSLSEVIRQSGSKSETR
jgi:hypothetical protein